MPFDILLRDNGAGAFDISLGESIVKQSSTYGSTSDNTSHTITWGTAPVEGNLMVIACTANSGTINTPSGWTEAVTQVSFVKGTIFYKVAGASEGTSQAITIGNTESFSAVFLEIEGIATSSPLDVTASAGAQGGGNSISTGTTGNTSQANTVLIALAGFRNENGTFNITAWSNSFSEVAEVSSINAADVNMGTAVALLEASSIATYSTVATLSGSSIGFDVGLIAAFKVASPGSTLTPSLGQVDITGLSPALTVTLAPSLGQAAYTGIAPALTSRLGTGLAAVVVTGINASLSGSLSPSLGQVLITGTVPALSFTAAPASGAVVLTGIAPELSVSRLLSPSVGEITVQGISPALSFTLQTGIGQCVVTGIAPGLTVSLLPGIASLLFDGITPGIDRVVLPGIGELQIDGSPVSFWVSVSPGAGEIVFEGQSPDIEYILLPGGGALVLTGEGPSFVLGSAPGLGSLVFTGIVPNISVVSSQVKLKLWDGAAFTTGKLKMWTGTEFIEGRLRRHLGNGNFD